MPAHLLVNAAAQRLMLITSLKLLVRGSKLYFCKFLLMLFSYLIHNIQKETWHKIESRGSKTVKNGKNVHQVCQLTHFLTVIIQQLCMDVEKDAFHYVNSLC